MRVFLTGASGWIGSAVVPDLLASGHHVVGLARSASSASALTSIGATAHPGSLDDLDSLRAGAAQSDGVIHLAYRHDLVFSGEATLAAESDLLAIEALGSALEGSDRPFVVATGLGGLPVGRVATEKDEASVERAGGQRAAAAKVTLGFADQRVRSAVVRLPPSVHGSGDTGFIPMIIDIARRTGISAYADTGDNRWPAIHRFDAAKLFRISLESAPAGSVLHGVGDHGVAMRDIADVIARQLDRPAVSIPANETADHFGWIADLLRGDFPTSSAATRELLGWHPTHPNLLDDLDEGHYF